MFIFQRRKFNLAVLLSGTHLSFYVLSAFFFFGSWFDLSAYYGLRTLHNVSSFSNLKSREGEWLQRHTDNAMIITVCFNREMFDICYWAARFLSVENKKAATMMLRQVLWLQLPLSVFTTERSHKKRDCCQQASGSHRKPAPWQR